MGRVGKRGEEERRKDKAFRELSEVGAIYGREIPAILRCGKTLTPPRESKSWPPSHSFLIRFIQSREKASMAGFESSALCINDVLSHHLLVEVLVRIPLKDVFRCMSVCKFWFSSIRDDPYFKRRFILKRVTEQASSSAEDHQLVYAQCSIREMLLVTPTCSIVNGSDLSLNLLPFIAGQDYYSSTLDRVVLGSSNGLLLCSPYKTMPATYYICNPLTKEWLTLPPSPHKDSPDVYVGFICDPFYLVQGDDSLITLNDGFGFKVVRWRYSSSDEDEEEDLFGMDVEVFSSDVGLWTTSRARCVKGVTSTALPAPGTGISYDGRLYWLLGRCETLIYDPNKNEFLLHHITPPSDVLCMIPLVLSLMVPFQGLSQCQGSFWAGQAWRAELRVYTLADGEWHLKHNVNILDWLPSSANSVKNTMKILPNAVQFRTMHPYDPMIAYLTVEMTLLECDFGGRTLKVVAENLGKNKEGRGLMWSNVLTLSLPLWPTPLPTLPAA
ncbi:unnamed protein product [Linum tenue]|uniref:F-box domain-containing protein n=1 Tax=Linum tenue TaxID=586396 RepID=A0AAV0RZD2_9ROSI|nr:unnamed protein product [Linum tenue]